MLAAAGLAVIGSVGLPSPSRAPSRVHLRRLRPAPGAAAHPGAGRPAVAQRSARGRRHSGDVPLTRNLPDQWRAATVTQYHTEATQDLAAQVRAGSRPPPDVVIWPESSTDLDPASARTATPQSRALSALSADRCGSAPCCRTPAQRGPAVAAAPRPRRRLRQAPAGTVRREHPVQRPAVAHHVADRAAASQLHPRPPGSCVPHREDQARRRDLLRGRVRRPDEVGGDRRANLLAVQSNDAGFEPDGQLGESEQQVAMARIRAIESDRAVVYASATGDSAIISPDGLCVPKTSSTPCDQAIFVGRATGASLSSDAVLVKIDRFGRWFQRRGCVQGSGGAERVRSRSPRRHPPIQRSAIAFIRGVWTLQSTVWHGGGRHAARQYPNR